MNFDSMIASLLGMFAMANDAQINTIVDDAADKLTAAVKNSETAIDDAAARVLADKLERLAARVKASL